MDFGVRTEAYLRIEPGETSRELVAANVTLIKEGFLGTVRMADELYAIPARGRPYQFFRELANDWRGWDGARDWIDIGGQFKVSATHDRSSKVILSVTLTDYLVTLVGCVSLEPGAELDRLASYLESIFPFPDPPPRFPG
jgi:hypothetical protein